MRRSRMVMALGALVIAASTAAPGAAGAATPSAAGGLPALVQGKKAGPMTIRKQQRTVASLALTKGRWLVFAKAIIVGTGGNNSSHLGVDCRLKVGKRSDLVTAVPKNDNGPGSRVPIFLTAAGILKKASNTTVSCKAEVGGATKIREIRVIALKVGTLTTRKTVAVSSGPSATTGSGKPVLISAKQGSPRDVSSGGSYHTVASLPLSSGLWWITAKGVADQANASTTDMDCLLLTGGVTSDVAGFGLRSAGPNPGDAVPFTLVGIHDFGSPGDAEIQCQGDTGYRVRNVVINAMKLGTLDVEALSPVVGSGNPTLRIGYDNGPLNVPVSSNLETILSMPIPKGKWFVLVKAWYSGSPGSAVLQANCQLGWSGVKDQVELKYADDPSEISQVVMMVPDSTPGGQSATLRCRRESGGFGQVMWVKISALKLKSILAWPL